MTFNSAKGGALSLNYNGKYAAGFNGFSPSAEKPYYEFGPQWTQLFSHDTEVAIATLGNGGTVTANYSGIHSGCVPQASSVNCIAGVNNDGSTYVTGTNCTCSNCGAPTSQSTAPVVRAPTRAQAQQAQTQTTTSTTTNGGSSLPTSCTKYRDQALCDSKCVKEILVGTVIINLMVRVVVHLEHIVVLPT